MHRASSPLPRARRGSIDPKALVLTTLLLTCAGTTQAATRTATVSGAWNSTATWGGNPVPAAADDVIIAPNVTVWLASAQLPTGPTIIQANTLRVQNNGRLVSDEFDGFGGNISIQTTRATVDAGGAIKARNSIPGLGGGGSISVVAGIYVNNGLYEAGDGEDGGSITLNVPTTAATSYVGVGDVRAGDANDPFGGGTPGMVFLRAGQVVVLGTTDARIYGGDTVNPNKRGGSVEIRACASLVINGVAGGTVRNVKGGDNISGAANAACGGNVTLRSECCQPVVVNSGAWVAAGSPTFQSPGQYSIMSIYSCGRSRVYGTTTGGCVYWDPPELEIGGDGLVSGQIVQIAGQTITALALNPGAGIEAADRLDVIVSPGGSLNLSAVGPGQWFRAGNALNIFADSQNITLPPGLTLASLASRPPTLAPGRLFRNLCASPDSSSATVVPGQSVSVPVSIQNCGTADDTYAVVAADSAGWLVSGLSQNTPLNPGATFDTTLQVQVPANAAPGSSTTITFTVQSQIDPNVADSATLTYRVPLPACIADTDNGTGTGIRDGGVGIEDLLFYAGLYNDGDPRADVDDGSGTGTRDGGIGVEDLLYYLLRYDIGC